MGLKGSVGVWVATAMEACSRCKHEASAHIPDRAHPLVNLGAKDGRHTYMAVRCEECGVICPMGSVTELVARFREVRAELAPPPGMETEGLGEPVRAMKAQVRRR